MMNKQDLMKAQTCVLRVNIHCDGCKQKVKKTLQKVDGVYSVKIDSEQGRVTVSGNADPADLVKKLTKSGKHAELWGRGNNFQNQFTNMMQMDGKKSHKGVGGKEQPKGGGFPQQFKGFKDLKAPTKDQKSVKFNLHDEDYSDDDEDYSDDEDYTDDEDYSEEDDSEDESDHKHPPPKVAPFMNGKGQGVNGMMMNDKTKGGGGAADMKAMMMMLNEKKGGGGGHGGGKGKKDKNKESEDDEDDFDMPIKMGGKNGDGKNKQGKGKQGGGGVMRSIGGLFGGQKKSKECDHKNKNDHHHHQSGNGGKSKGGNNGKMGKDHGFNKGHGKADVGKINGGLQNINVSQGGKGGGGQKMGGGGYNMGHQAGPMQAVQGLPAQGGMYYPGPGMGMGQQQYMGMMMNQQQQQGGGEMYHPMMYARPPHPAVNYGDGYVPPMPPPQPWHVNPYSHMFSDENTESCSVM